MINKIKTPLNKEDFIAWIAENMPESTVISGLHLTPHKEVVREFEEPHHPKAVFQERVTEFTLKVTGETTDAGRVS